MTEQEKQAYFNNGFISCCALLDVLASQGISLDDAISVILKAINNLPCVISDQEGRDFNVQIADEIDKILDTYGENS